jgi:cysteine-rich repeat protein
MKRLILAGIGLAILGSLVVPPPPAAAEPLDAVAEAADQGHANAQTKLGSTYQEGREQNQVFFGIVGDGDCARVVVTVHLAAAGAEIDAIANCALDAAVAGCVSDVDLEGSLLTFAIETCTIDAVSALFSCSFESVNIDALKAATTAICECAGDDCDQTPPLCIDRAPSPTSCESDCGDGIDRQCVCGDGTAEGAEECDDGNTLDGDGCSRVCESQRLCGDAIDDGKVVASDALQTLRRAVGLDVDCPDWICDVNDDGRLVASDALQTLIFAVDGPATLQCGDPTALVLRMVSTGTLGSLQVDVDYGDVSATIPGEGLSVQCQNLTPLSEAVFNNKPDSILSVGFISVTGFTGPRSLARCELLPTANIEPEHFTVTVKDAANVEAEPVPEIEIQALPY